MKKNVTGIPYWIKDKDRTSSEKLLTSNSQLLILSLPRAVGPGEFMACFQGLYIEGFALGGNAFVDDLLQDVKTSRREHLDDCSQHEHVGHDPAF